VIILHVEFQAYINWIILFDKTGEANERNVINLPYFLITCQSSTRLNHIDNFVEIYLSDQPLWNSPTHLKYFFFSFREVMPPGWKIVGNPRLRSSDPR